MKNAKLKTIKKKDLMSFLGTLKKQYNVLVPIRKDGDVRFSEFDSGADILWDYRNTKISPKEIFFPQTEMLYEFSGQEIVENELPTPNYLIFGIRPCDAQAFSLLDKLFGGDDFRDTCYLKRREQATIISLACRRPQITCFCASVKGKPDNEEGSDIILFDLDESILVKPVTEKGEKFAESFSKWCQEAKQSEIEEKDKLMDLSLKKVRSQVNVENIKEKLDKSFDAAFWNELHQKCLGCGICTYLCPTCHCFDITDEVRNARGKRLRCWDSCMFPLFTLHASGHNPRPSYKERMRQRIMHKFSYCPENFEEIFCVGCGRCIRDCPVNLDIREVLKTAVGD